MISGDAVDVQIERADRCLELLVGTGRLVLDQVARRTDEVGLPVTITIMLNDA